MLALFHQPDSARLYFFTEFEKIKQHIPYNGSSASNRAEYSPICVKEIEVIEIFFYFF
jgi:hypothetical protein